MSDATIQGENQHVIGRLLDPMSEAAKALGLSAFSREGGLIEPDASPLKDKTCVMEVLTCGPGNVSRGALNPCTIQHGQLVIANLFHRTHEIMVQGENVCTFNWENIMARINVNDAEQTIDLEPLQGFIICRVNEARARHIMMGQQARILAPGGDAQLSGGTRYDERGRPKEQIKVAVEDVVQVGPGAVIDGLWQEPTQKPGDAVMYDTSVSPVRFTIGGHTVTLVHMRHVIMTIRAVSNAKNETAH